MTTEEKLQNLFKAALSEPETKAANPQGPAERNPPVIHPAPTAAAPGFVAVESPAPVDAPGSATTPAPNAGLDEDTSAELGRLLDERITRTKRKDRRNRLFAVAALALASGGAIFWVTSNPDRLGALKQTVSDIKTVGDRDEMLSSYDQALEKIAGRNDEFDEAAAALGATPEPRAEP